MEAYWGVEV